MSVNAVNKTDGTLTKVAGNTGGIANNVLFDDSTSHLGSNKVQGAIDSLTTIVNAKQPVTDNTLQTTDKTVPGAINELKSGLINLTKVYKAIKYVDLAAGADTWVDIYPSDFGLTGSIDMTTMGILAFGYGDYGAVCTVQANNGGGSGYVMSAEHSFKIYVKSGAEGSARFYVTIILVN